TAGLADRIRRRPLLLRAGLGRLPPRPCRRDHDHALDRANRVRHRRRLIRVRRAPVVPLGRLRAVGRLPTLPTGERQARDARDGLPPRARARAPGDGPAASEVTFGGRWGRRQPTLAARCAGSIRAPDTRPNGSGVELVAYERAGEAM